MCKTKCIIAYTPISEQRDIEGVTLPYNQKSKFVLPLLQSIQGAGRGCVVEVRRLFVSFLERTGQAAQRTATGISGAETEVGRDHKVGNDVHWHYPLTVTQLPPVCVTLQAACDAFVSRLSRIALAPLQVASCSSGGGASMRMDGEAFGGCIAPNP